MLIEITETLKSYLLRKMKCGAPVRPLRLGDYRRFGSTDHMLRGADG